MIFLKKDLKVLRQSKLFTGIKGEEICLVLKCLSPAEKAFTKSEYILRSGDRIKSMGLVLSGCVHIIKEDYWGNRTILTEVHPGQLFGEAYACFQAEELQVDVLSVRSSAVLFFDINRILTPCSDGCVYHTRLVQNLVSVLAEKNLALTGKIEHLSQRRTRDKILSYLSDVSQKQGNCEFTVPFNRQELADYLCVDRSALSNELSKLKKEGILDYEKNCFRLL